LKKLQLYIESFFNLDAIKIDWKITGTVLFAAGCLILAEYFDSIYGIQHFFAIYFHKEINLYNLLPVPSRPVFQNLLVWGINCVITFLLLPVVFIKIILREKLSNFGLNLHLEKRFILLYTIMFLVMIPVLIYLSYTAAFLEKYPFFKIQSKAELPLFLKWEIIYILQFVGIEFFFRGLLIHAFKHKFGYYSILFSVIPYCMIHFGKPLPETIGAIFAGLILGFLSLNTGSIILGILLHCGIAVTMDFLALGALFSQ